MPQLPPHPNLDQLRRRARELQRAACDGDPKAQSRMARLGLQPTTLNGAQLVVARDHGFPSWAALRAEVTRRNSTLEARPSAEGDEHVARRDGPPLRSWRGMRSQITRQLEDRTGLDIAEWKSRVTEQELSDERSLRAWLLERGVTGYPQSLLVWERFGYPDFLTGDAVSLIDGQYRDRAHLRPILDAVLARLPEIGEVTLQARKTYISLVSPRRTFATIQPTTKKRVDLGLRLDRPAAGGRLLPAGSVGNGAITGRIELSSLTDVDAEVVGWLRRAYAENTAAERVAPSATHRHAPVRSLGWISVVIEGHDLPGLTCRPEPNGTVHHEVHVALCSREREREGLTIVPSRGDWRAVEPVPGGAATARWEVRVSVRRDERGLDFGGPTVRGHRDDRNLGLVWGGVPGDGTLRLFRGAKLRLADIEPALVEHVLASGGRLVARLGLTDEKGNPRCARVRPPLVTWAVEATGTMPGLEEFS